ncbi:MAG: hypothetical protein A2977_00455 [Alphaproteobacteria bacterium RIFCSPLOWO2_01_FULL_45_8]|nr:MAG: hypothetical protein A2065_03190 [Alphaproteobacteria bacterium GWB1_45_5]OFW76576.1 MAG: hypothetical protein A3K20_00115 [Alphaproteobacteria bacterium GWA1_45_9]OFW89660.1 MAG: hypothetical protein A2621_02005 [Alphaproteobacteria bacterium RIFCSPHIGHO2_01_FULL_41_14]OFW96132.1 MAG: hypothetical protein A2977_00455 [Alphaproteobacteria bacterium RIFCSPLOWO2_01_FULL_45_8]HCI49101.1 hypothetical protein [Holosporales bacterium]
MTYEYLKQFIPGGSEVNDNWFLPLKSEEIVTAEQKLGVNFPSQLRSFYQEIGFGMLRSPEIPPAGYEFYNNNEILPPLVVAHFSKEIIRFRTETIEGPAECEDHWMSNATLEMLEPGDLPFFEIGDSSRFLIMRPASHDPNAVWTPSHIKIEDSFERFIWRLYYESPWFYDDIIEAHYNKSRLS